MTEIRFTVYGQPVAKARARTFATAAGKVGSYTPRATREWERWIREEAGKHRPPQLLDGPLVLEATFYVLKPKSSPRRRQYPDTKPDVENLGKAVCDALQGLIYVDDSRIVEEILRKRFGDPPRVEIAIRAAEAVAS